MEIFVDGVLLDVEWPLGAMVEAGKPLASHPAVKALNVEASVATANQQIVERSGGKDAVAKREVEIYGPNNSSPPFFRPRGFDTHAGDGAPMFVRQTMAPFLPQRSQPLAAALGLGWPFLWRHFQRRFGALGGASGRRKAAPTRGLSGPARSRKSAGNMSGSNGT